MPSMMALYPRRSTGPTITLSTDNTDKRPVHPDWAEPGSGGTPLEDQERITPEDDSLSTLFSNPSSELTIDISVTGMSCAGCASRVESALIEVSGVRTASVNFGNHRATVHVSDNLVSVPGLVDAVEGTGYGVATAQASIAIQGMSCASCVSKVEQSISDVPGVISVAVNLGTSRASVAFLPGLTTVREISSAIRSAGYSTIEAEEEELVDREEEARRREVRDLQRKLSLSVVLSALVMIGSMDVLTAVAPRLASIGTFTSCGSSRRPSSLSPAGSFIGAPGRRRVTAPPT